MEVTKRIINLCSGRKTVAILSLKTCLQGVKAELSKLEDIPCGAVIIGYSGRYFMLENDCFYGADIKNGFACAIVYNGAVIAEGASSILPPNVYGFIEYEKNYKISKKENITQEATPVYDDFQIATENYFEKEGFLNEPHQNNNNDDLAAKPCKKAETKTYGNQTVFNEADCNNNEKPPFTEGSFCGEKTTSTVKCDSPAEKIPSGGHIGKGGFLKITRGRPEFHGFKNILPDSEFYIISDFPPCYFGVINAEEGSYFCYAAPGKYGHPPVGFEKAYFVPKDFFTHTEGFFCLFQKQ